MTMNQPTTISDAASGSSASGLNSSATMTGGAHDTNGPKNGIAMSRPADDRRQRDAAAGPGRRLVTRAIAK